MDYVEVLEKQINDLVEINDKLKAIAMKSVPNPTQETVGITRLNVESQHKAIELIGINATIISDIMWNIHEIETL